MITNRKPIRNLKYVFEPDNHIVNDERNKIIENRRNLQSQSKAERVKCNNDIVATDSDESLDLQDITLDKSSSSCLLKEIQGIIFGGQNSRFWMLRKHINMMKPEDLKDLPFHSWNCITLLRPHRCGDVDLVIKSETHMSIFIQLLVYSLQTIDGHKNTAKPILS